ncbi:MAG: SGNH/GDSL hydrolase family protein, partial [Nanoarchaeota archaeon]
MDSKKNVKFLLLSLILFISLFSIVVGQTDTKSLCDYKKVGVVGASNTVLGSHRKSWVVFLDEKCPQTKFIVNAEVGAGPTEQLSLLQNLIASNTDLEMIILNPSDNEINGDINSYITTVKEMAELAKGKEGKRKVVVLTNTPSKGYPKWNGIWNKVYENKMNFNKELLESHLGSSNIDVAIDIYSSVGSTSDPDTCGYCASSDHIHLEISGMEKVANAILNKLGVTAATNKGTSPALTLVSLGTPQQPACTQTKVAKTNIPGCQDSQRC